MVDLRIFEFNVINQKQTKVDGFSTIDMVMCVLYYIIALALLIPAYMFTVLCSLISKIADIMMAIGYVLNVTNIQHHIYIII